MMKHLRIRQQLSVADPLGRERRSHAAPGELRARFSSFRTEKCMENKVTEASEIIQEIKHILVEDMQLNVIPEAIPDNYSLLESGLALDSILIAELITRIEDRFGLQLDDDALNAELFNNLSLLAGFVAQRQRTAQFNVRDNQSEEATC
jgi:acyl carrier protein